MGAASKDLYIDDIGVIVQAIKEDWITADNDYVTADDVELYASGGGPPYYLFGHRLGISQQLDAKNKDKVNKRQKYPFFGLRLDSTQKVVGDMREFNLNLAIIQKTKIPYSEEERKELVFKPILYPLHKLFFVKLRESGLFQWDGDQEVPTHTQIDRFYLGTVGQEGTEKKLFNDPVDAIEIIDLKIYQRVKSCLNLTEEKIAYGIR